MRVWFDKPPPGRLLAAVQRRVLIVLAWLLAALWLPATLHCTAEMAGWFDLTDCCDDQMATTADDALDHCATLDVGVPREQMGAAVLSVPVVVLLEILRPVIVAASEVNNGVTPRLAAPPEIGGLWRAVERVVAPARAP